MAATNNDGRLARIPLKNESKEFQAHQLLIALIKQRIEKYAVSIKVTSFALFIMLRGLLVTFTFLIIGRVPFRIGLFLSAHKSQ